jgi:glutamate synthase (NADPH/NADH) small chain
MKEAQRCVECKNPACEVVCPLSNRIRDWLILTAQGQFLQAAEVSQTTSNMPEICGRLCPQDRLCEGKCIVGIKGESVAIGAIERFINEYAFREGGIPTPEMAPPTGCRVAIVGSGPAGLACAEELAKKGHQVTVYEALPNPGGLLAYGIPGFKLEKAVVERRIHYLERIGITFVCNTRIGEEISLHELFDKGFNAMFLATGATKPKRAHLEGMELKGVHEALPFLIRNNQDTISSFDVPPPSTGGSEGESFGPPRGPGGGKPDNMAGKKVVVFGGGDTAMDCVRTAVRRGAAKVICAYRRDEANMPGSRREVKNAKEEGVQFYFLAQPVRFFGDETGHLTKIECIQMTLDELDVLPPPAGGPGEQSLGPPRGRGGEGRRHPVPIAGSNFTLEADFAILAFGFDGTPVPRVEDATLKRTRWGTYQVDENFMTSWPGVFAGGDNVRGAALIVTALKEGRTAAKEIDHYLKSR